MLAGPNVPADPAGRPEQHHAQELQEEERHHRQDGASMQMLLQVRNPVNSRPTLITGRTDYKKSVEFTTKYNHLEIRSVVS